jgi:hypothetical protein
VINILLLGGYGNIIKIIDANVKIKLILLILNLLFIKSQ